MLKKFCNFSLIFNLLGCASSFGWLSPFCFTIAISQSVDEIHPGIYVFKIADARVHIWKTLPSHDRILLKLQAISMVKRTPAYKNRLKALELERTGGIANKKKGHKQLDK
jgi:hypothetical protein